MHRTTSIISCLAVVGLAGCAQSLDTDDGLVQAVSSDKDCHVAGPSQYFLEWTDEECTSAYACYSGQIIGGGFLSGDLYLTIQGRALSAGLPGGHGAVGSYYGESTLTNQHGSLTYRHVGLLVEDGLPRVRQSDVSTVMPDEGTGLFSSASGVFQSVGTATLRLPGGQPDGSLTEISGRLYGEICFQGPAD